MVFIAPFDNGEASNSSLLNKRFITLTAISITAHFPVTNWKVHMFYSFETITEMWGKLSKRRDIPIPAKIQHCWSSAFVPTLQDRAESWAVPLSTQDWHERGEKTFPNGAEDGPLFSLWCASSKRVATSETPFHFLWSQFPTEAASAFFFF